MKIQFTYFIAITTSVLYFSQQIIAQIASLYGNPIENTAKYPVWYFIRTGNNNVFELSTSGILVNSATTALTQNSDGMFWRFEKKADETYAIYNKARTRQLTSIFTWDGILTFALTVNIVSVSGTST